MTNSYAEVFKQAGHSYHSAMRICPNARDQEFLAAIDLLELMPNQHVLDVPAGGGYLQAYLPEYTHYHAIDFAGSFGHNRVIQCCDENSLDLPDNSMDRILCLAALHHIQDRQGFFAELKRVLKPNGLIVIGDVIQGSKQAEFLNGFVDRWNPLGHKGKFLTPDIELNQLESLGFKSNFLSKKYNWKFTDLAAATNYCSKLFYLKESLTNEALLNALHELGMDAQQKSPTIPWSLGFIQAKLAD